nr:hypothetical protein [Petroclostridium xylanilyticum]
MMDYQCVTTLQEISDYLCGANLVAFDFETTPKEEYRRDEKAALDAQISHNGNNKFSVCQSINNFLRLICSTALRF